MTLIERIIYIAGTQYGYVKSFNPGKTNLQRACTGSQFLIHFIVAASSVLFGLVIWAIFAIQNMVAKFW